MECHKQDLPNSNNDNKNTVSIYSLDCHYARLCLVLLYHGHLYFKMVKLGFRAKGCKTEFNPTYLVSVPLTPGKVNRLTFTLFPIIWGTPKTCGNSRQYLNPISLAAKLTHAKAQGKIGLGIRKPRTPGFQVPKARLWGKKESY